MKGVVLTLIIVASLVCIVSAQTSGEVYELEKNIHGLEHEIVGALEDVGIDAGGYYVQREEIEIKIEEMERLLDEGRSDEAEQLRTELVHRERLMLDAMAVVMQARRGIVNGGIPRDKREVVYEMGLAFGRGDFQNTIEIWGELKRQAESTRDDIEVQKRVPEEEVEKNNGGVNWEALGVMLVVAGASAGWFIQKKKRSHVAGYMNEIDNVYSSYKMKTRRCEAELYRLKDMIVEDFKSGKIDHNSFVILDKRVDDYLKDVREQIMNERFGGLPSQLKGELHKMLEDGSIGEAEFSTFEGILEKSAGLKDKEKRDLKDMIKEWKEKDRDGS